MQQSTIQTSTASGDLQLSPAQVVALKNAVQTLDNFLLKCVQEKRQNLWRRQETRDIADYRLRELLRAVAHIFQIKPINDTTRRARTKLLTHRVRVVLQAFNQHRSYALATPPGIQWDEDFIPPNLYPESVRQAPGEVDGGKEAGISETADVDTGKAKEKGVGKGKGKERAAGERGSLPDKGKGKARELATTSTTTSPTIKTEPLSPSAAATKIIASRKRKNISPETIEDSDDVGRKKRKVSSPENDSGYEGHPAPGRRLPAIKSRPPTKSRPKNRAKIIPFGNLLPPGPCRRCLIRQETCIPVGWKAACKSCSKARQACEHSKAKPPPEAIPPEAMPVAGSSKRIPKVKIVIPQTMHAKGSGPRMAVILPDTSDVPHVDEVSAKPGDAAGTSSLAISIPAQSGIRRVTPAGPAEPQILNTTTVPPMNPDLTTLWERIQEQDLRIREQDRRMREVEAGEIAGRGVMVTQDQLREQDREIRVKLKEQDREIRVALSAVTDDLHHQSRRIEKKVDSYTQGDVKSLLTRMVNLGEEVASIGEMLDGQDKHMQEELQSAERRWERQLHQQERQLEVTIEETDVRLQSQQREMAERMDNLCVQVERMDTLSARVDEAILKITEDNLKAPWKRQLEEASLGWQKELQSAMAARPTRDEFSAYTTLLTTEKICTQLGSLQLRTDEQYNGLQGDVHTLERLYLRQVDQTGDMGNVSHKLREVLASQRAEDEVRATLAAKRGPPGRILKGIPRRARATSGPPNSPTRPGHSRTLVSLEGEGADVEMKDVAVGQGGPHELTEDNLGAPRTKRARSIQPKSLALVGDHFPRRTRSQSRSGFLPQLPVVCPPPTIPELPAGPIESSPLSSAPGEPAEISMSDILQDHILNA